MELVSKETSQVEAGSRLTIIKAELSSASSRDDNVDKKPLNADIYDLTNNNVDNNNTSEGDRQRHSEQVETGLPLSPDSGDQTKLTVASPVTPDSYIKDSCNSSLDDDVIKAGTSTPLKPDAEDELSDIVHPSLCHLAELSGRASDRSSTGSEYSTAANLSFPEVAGVQYVTMKTSPYLNTSLTFPGPSPAKCGVSGLGNSAAIRCPPVREAVDPAKYITISGEPDGVKYACSKCGNIYKWRKSLNKHWKEKHDGEAPDAAAVSAAAAASNRYPRLPQPVKRPSPASAFGSSSSSAGTRSLSSASRHSALPGSLAAILPPLSSQSGPNSNVRYSPVTGRDWNHTSQLKTPTFADYKIPSTMTASPFSLLAVDAASSKERPVDLSGAASHPQPTATDAFDCSDVVLDLSKKGVSIISSPSTNVQDEPIDFSTKPGSRSARNPPCELEMPGTTFAGRPPEFAHAGNVISAMLNCAQCRQKFTVPSKLNQHFAEMHADLLQTTAAASATTGHSGETSYTGSTQLYRYLTADPGASRESIRCVVCGAGFLWRSAAAKHFDQEHVGLYPNPYQLSGDAPPGPADRNSSHIRPGAAAVAHQLTGSGNQLSCGRCPFTTDSFSVLARHHLRHSPRRPAELMAPDVSRIIWGDSDDMKAAELQLLSAAGATTVNMDDVMGENTAIVIPQAPEDTLTTVVGPSSSLKPFKQTASRSSGVRNKRTETGTGSSTASAETLLPFKCELCEYRARWPSEMTQHAKNHSDEKPYHCPQCTYRSKWKWDVVKHLKRCGGGGTARDVIDTTNLSISTSSSSSVAATSAAACQTARRRRTNVRSLLTDVPSTPSPCSYDRGQTDVKETSTQPATVTSTLSSTVLVREPLSNGPPNVMIVTGSEKAPTDGAVQTGAKIASTSAVQAKPADVPAPIVSLVNQGLHYCLQCSFVGHSPAELRRHLRVHSDEKPYSCRTCCYSSKWKCDLKKHLRAYNHVSAVPLAYGGHGRKPSSDEQPQKDGVDAAVEDEISAPADDSDEIATDASGSLSGTVSSLKPDDKDSMQTKAPRMPNGSNFGGITVGGRLRCRRCYFEAIDLTSFLQHKSTHAVSRKDDNGNQQLIVQTVATSGATRPSHHRRKSSKQMRVLPDSKTDKYIDNTAAIDVSTVSMNYAKQQNDDESELPNAEDGSKFWTSLGLRSKNGVSCIQTAPKNELDVTGSSAMNLIVDSTDEERSSMVEMETWSHQSSSPCDESLIASVITASPAGSSHDTDVDLDQPVDLCRRLVSNDVDDAPRLLEADTAIPCPVSRQVLSIITERVTTTEADDATGLSKRKRKLRTCDKCGYITDNLTTLQRHAAKHGSTGRHRCKQCDYTVDRQHILDYHVKNVHGPAGTALPLAASTTDEHKTTMNPSDEEETTGLDEEELQQNAAGDEASSCSAVKQRRTSVHGDIETRLTAAAMYTCIRCGYSGHSVGAMARHRLSHSAWSLPHRCRQCSRRAATRSLLVKHARTHDERQSQSVSGVTHSPSAEQHACSYCPHKSPSPLQVAAHERRHTTRARYNCRFCSFTGNERRLVARHQRVHASDVVAMSSSAARLHCSVVDCPFTSLLRDELTSHGRHHAITVRRRRHVCDRCSFAVDSRNALLHHRRLHG